MKPPTLTPLLEKILGNLVKITASGELPTAAHRAKAMKKLKTIIRL